MNNILKHISIGVTAATALQVLAGNKQLLPRLAIQVPDDVALLQKLYAAMAAARHQPFVLILPDVSLAEEILNNLPRFFFLTNYGVNNNIPVVITGKSVNERNQNSLHKWCMAQGFAQTAWVTFERFEQDKDQEEEVVYVMPDEKDAFLHFYKGKIKGLTWFNTQVICAVKDAESVMDYVAAFNSIVDSLKEDGGGAYKLLHAMRVLEADLQQKDKLLQYGEIEINNQKLYNSMAGVLDEETANPDFNNLSDDTDKLRGMYIKLWREFVRLRNELAWYKRTYEDRSTIGVIKEKIMKNLRKP